MVNQNAQLLSMEARSNFDVLQRSEMLNNMLMEIIFNDCLNQECSTSSDL